MFVKNILTHVHKVIHLMVSTFEQGWRSWRVEVALFFTDRTLVPKWPDSEGERPVIYSSEGRGLDLRLDSDRMTERTRRLCARSWSRTMTWAISWSQRGSDSGLRPVIAERTRPIVIFPLWMLTGVDRTPRAHASCLAEARPVLARMQRGGVWADAESARQVVAVMHPVVT
jgi:hypothetical protein